MAKYRRLKPADFFRVVNNERRARQWLWRSKYEGRHTFECPRCTHKGYWEHKSRPEIRTCRLCKRQVRLRAGTILEHTKIPILVWLRAIFLCTQDKRGISAVQLQRQLGLTSKDTTWRLLHRIRAAMQQRDERYQLKGIIELDGADFGEQKDKQKREVLLAVETKTFPRNGKELRRAGFAKVAVARETTINAQKFLAEHVVGDAIIHTDGSPSYAGLKGVNVESRVMNADPKKLDAWLPWVFHWTENAKAWLQATHHGVSTKYFKRYLAEYTYRFNRRHDQDGLFHRTLTACALAQPMRATGLFGEA